MKKIYGKMLLVGAAAAVCALAGNANARVAGPCSDCHTMHNSQNGTNMQFATDASPTAAKRALTRGDCIGCHTDSSAASSLVNKGGTAGTSVVPIVWNTGGVPTSFMLGGGNFYWIGSGTSSNSKGHNVVGIQIEDGVLHKVPPGYNTSTATPSIIGSGPAGGPSSSSWGSQLTCAGTYGCHGKHAAADDFTDISGAHHASDSNLKGGTGSVTGVRGRHLESVGGSYRFLAGIDGIEGSTFTPEANPTISGGTSNVYKGAARTTETVDDTTISFLCGECHGNFHSGTGNVSSAGFDSPWLRHPTDFDMNEVKTKADYAGYSAASYAQAPVGVNSFATENVGNVQNAGKAIVTCLSCHYAHGSANADLLRWDYSTMNAHSYPGGNTSGCFACHTTKDN